MKSNNEGRVVTAMSRRRLSTDQRRQEVINAAAELLGTEPLTVFSMDEVAKRAGASRALLYHYFSSKQELIRAAVAHESAVLDDMLEGLGLPEALDAYLRYVSSHSHGYRLLHDGPLQADPEVKAMVEQARSRIEQVVEEHLGMAPANDLTRLAVRGWTGFVISVCLDWASRQQPPQEAVLALLLDALPTIDSR